MERDGVAGLAEWSSLPPLHYSAARYEQPLEFDFSNSGDTEREMRRKKRRKLFQDDAHFFPDSMSDPSAWTTTVSNLGITLMGVRSQSEFDPGLGAMNPLLLSSQTMTPVVKEIIHRASCTLFPPNPNLPPPSTRTRPPGCKTIFVGGLPENASERTLREIFEPCGEILSVRRGGKTFCHLRFFEEQSVEQALYLSGYRIRLGSSSDRKDTGHLHVDYAQARDDLYEWECLQRMLAREERHRRRTDPQRLRSPSPPPVILYCEHEGNSVAERLKDSATFRNAVHTLITWMERGEVNKQSAKSFYSMIQSLSSSVRRLQGEAQEHKRQLEEAKEVFKSELNAILHQFEQILHVFHSASKQRVQDHFTKAQRKNLVVWREQMQEVHRLQSEELLGIRCEQEMEMSEEETEGTEQRTSPRRGEADQLREENEKLLYQLEVLRKELQHVRGLSDLQHSSLMTEDSLAELCDLSTLPVEGSNHYEYPAEESAAPGSGIHESPREAGLLQETPTRGNSLHGTPAEMDQAKASVQPSLVDDCGLRESLADVTTPHKSPPESSNLQEPLTNGSESKGQILKAMHQVTSHPAARVSTRTVAEECPSGKEEEYADSSIGERASVQKPSDGACVGISEEAGLDARRDGNQKPSNEACLNARRDGNQEYSNEAGLDARRDGNQEYSNEAGLDARRDGNQEYSNEAGLDARRDGNQEYSNEAGLDARRDGNQEYSNEGCLDARRDGNQKSSNEAGLDARRDGNQESSNEAGLDARRDGNQKSSNEACLDARRDGNQEFSNEAGLDARRDGNQESSNEACLDARRDGNQESSNEACLDMDTDGECACVDTSEDRFEDSYRPRSDPQQNPGKSLHLDDSSSHSGFSEAAHGAQHSSSCPQKEPSANAGAFHMRSQRDALLVGIISTFLNVHPHGASIEYICSYLQQLDRKVSPQEVLNLFSSHHCLFYSEVLGIGATLENRWKFCGFQQLPLTSP